MASERNQGRRWPNPSEPIRALSVDPGGTTGYAICNIKTNKSIEIGWDQTKLTEYKLGQLITDVEPDFVICEDFEYRNKARAGLDLSAPKLIGVVKMICEMNCISLRMQKASQGKSFWTDDKLKFFMLYRPGTQHGRDATRHLLHWLVFGEGMKYVEVTDRILSVDDITVLPVEELYPHHPA